MGVSINIKALGPSIVIVQKYSDLPDPTTVPMRFYRTLEGENASWIPTWLGGTYYPKGIYQAVGTTWDYVGEFPFQASLDEVNVGEDNEKFVTPYTFDKAAKWDEKVNVVDLPSNLVFYSTSATSDVLDYTKLVTSLADPSYNITPVDIPTGAITTSDQEVGVLVSAAGLINGNPGIINITTLGNIRRTTNNGTAEFYFKVFHRNIAGVETLIATSSKTPIITGTSYEQFFTTALLNNGEFISTDRIVIKYYATKVGSPEPEYEFQFGGSQPVRTLFPVPLTASFSGGGTWGSIGGVLSNQTDLQTALNGKQNIPTLAATDVTAVNNEIYNNVGTVTYTDPAPVTGRGYTVNVVSGTATVGATAYAVAGTRILRIYDGASWNTYVLSGTNTGDETQSTILTKLGWFKIIDTTDSATLTGVTTETIMKAVQLPSLTDGSKFKINDLRVTKAGVATCTIRAYINNVDDNLSGAVQILTNGSFPASGKIATMERTFKIESGNIKGVSGEIGVFTDKAQSTATPLNAILPTGTLYLIVTLQHAAAESSQVELIDISNF
jgi:hypothetical protein